MGFKFSSLNVFKDGGWVRSTEVRTSDPNKVVSDTSKIMVHKDDEWVEVERIVCNGFEVYGNLPPVPGTIRVYADEYAPIFVNGEFINGMTVYGRYEYYVDDAIKNVENMFTAFNPNTVTSVDFFGAAFKPNVNLKSMCENQSTIYSITISYRLTPGSDMSNAFRGTSFDYFSLSDWNLSGVKNMDGLFADMEGVRTLNFENTHLSLLVSAEDMFVNTPQLGQIRVQGCDEDTINRLLDALNASDAGRYPVVTRPWEWFSDGYTSILKQSIGKHLFSGAINSTPAPTLTINGNRYDVESEGFDWYFDGDIDSFDLSNVCAKQSTVYRIKFDQIPFEKVTSLANAFSETPITIIDFTDFITSYRPGVFDEAFIDCYSLEKVCVKGCNERMINEIVDVLNTELKGRNWYYDQDAEIITFEPDSSIRVALTSTLDSITLKVNGKSFSLPDVGAAGNVPIGEVATSLTGIGTEAPDNTIVLYDFSNTWFAGANYSVSLYRAFTGGSSIGSIYFGDTMFRMGDDCEEAFMGIGVHQLDLTKLHGRPYKIDRMFKDCEALEVLDTGNVMFSNLSYRADVFVGCSSLQKVYVDNQTDTAIDNLKALLNRDDAGIIDVTDAPWTLVVEDDRKVLQQEVVINNIIRVKLCSSSYVKPLHINNHDIDPVVEDGWLVYRFNELVYDMSHVDGNYGVQMTDFDCSQTLFASEVWMASFMEFYENNATYNFGDVPGRIHVTSLYRAFRGNDWLQKGIDLRALDVSECKWFEDMFERTWNMPWLDLSGWDLKQILDDPEQGESMFSTTSALNRVWVDNCSEATINYLKEALRRSRHLGAWSLYTYGDRQYLAAQSLNPKVKGGYSDSAGITHVLINNTSYDVEYPGALYVYDIKFAGPYDLTNCLDGQSGPTTLDLSEFAGYKITSLDNCINGTHVTTINLTSVFPDDEFVDFTNAFIGGNELTEVRVWECSEAAKNAMIEALNNTLPKTGYVWKLSNDTTVIELAQVQMPFVVRGMTSGSYPTLIVNGNSAPSWEDEETGGWKLKGSTLGSSVNFSNMLLGDENVTSVDMREVTCYVFDTNQMFKDMPLLEEIDFSYYTMHNQYNWKSNSFESTPKLKRVKVSNRSEYFVTQLKSALEESSAGGYTSWVLIGEYLKPSAITGTVTGKGVGDVKFTCSGEEYPVTYTTGDNFIVDLPKELTSYDKAAIEEMNLVEVDLSNITGSGTQSISQMFYLCSNLSEVKMGFSQANIKNMAYLFSMCSSLITVKGLNNLNTYNCEDLSGMFNGCSSLEELELDGWDIRNAQSNYMFNGCNSLYRVSVAGCSHDTVTTLSSQLAYDHAGGCDAWYRFQSNLIPTGVNAVITKGLSGTDPGLIANGETHLSSVVKAFPEYRCTSFGSDLTDLSRMAEGRSDLTYMEFAAFNGYEVTSLASMFKGCENLEDIKGFNAYGSITDISHMFEGCINLPWTVIAGGVMCYIDLSSVDNADYLFKDCKSGGSVDISFIDFSNISSAVGMFEGCTNLNYISAGSINLSNLDESKMTDFFKDCPNLKTVSTNLSSFDLSLKKIWHLLNACNAGGSSSWGYVNGELRA